MDAKQKNDGFLLTALWIAFLIGVKIVEHQRAFGKVEMKFRFDLFVVFPILLVVTLYYLWKHWREMDD
jgi:hypothetical protein